MAVRHMLEISLSGEDPLGWLIEIKEHGLARSQTTVVETWKADPYAGLGAIQEEAQKRGYVLALAGLFGSIYSEPFGLRAVVVQVAEAAETRRVLEQIGG